MEEKKQEPIEQESTAPSIDEEIANALRTVYDPEIPVNIYELGLIYKAEKNENGRVHVQMTLTSPNWSTATRPVSTPTSTRSARTG